MSRGIWRTGGKVAGRRRKVFPTKNTKRAMGAACLHRRHPMGDPKTIRFNDADNPQRLEEFEAALKRCGANTSEVVRLLAEAYTRYVEEHGQCPIFPVELVPRSAAKVKRKA